MSRPRIEFDLERVARFASTPKTLEEFTKEFGCAPVTAVRRVKELEAHGHLRCENPGHRPLRYRSIEGVRPPPAPPPAVVVDEPEEKEDGDGPVPRGPLKVGPLVINALREPRTAKEVSDLTGIPIPTCHRIIKALVQLGLVIPFERRLVGAKSAYAYMATIRWSSSRALENREKVWDKRRL